MSESLQAWMEKYGSRVGSLEVELNMAIVERSPERFWKEKEPLDDDWQDWEGDVSSDADDEVVGVAAPSTSAGHEDRTFKLQLPCSKLQQLMRLSVKRYPDFVDRIELDLSTQQQPPQQGSVSGISTASKLMPKLVDCHLPTSCEDMQQLFGTSGQKLTKLHVQQLWCKADNDGMSSAFLRRCAAYDLVNAQGAADCTTAVHQSGLLAPSGSVSPSWLRITLVGTGAVRCLATGQHQLSAEAAGTGDFLAHQDRRKLPASSASQPNTSGLDWVRGHD